MQDFLSNWPYFVLILARVMGLLLTAPVYGAGNLSFRTQMTLAFFLSIVLYPMTRHHFPTLPDGMDYFVLLVFSQTFVGVCIGFMISVIFAAFQFAGYIFSIQVGLSFSEVLDPQAQISIPVFGTLKNLIGLLLFVSVDFQLDGHYVPAHLQMIHALANSLVLIPAVLPDLDTFEGLATYMDGTLKIMLVTALKIGIPIMGILFITSVTLGLMGRAAPQMNLMNMGIQLNIIIGIFILFTLIPVFIPLMQDSFHRSYERVGLMLHDWNRLETHRREERRKAEVLGEDYKGDPKFREPIFGRAQGAPKTH